MYELDNYRQQIDDIDEELIRLLDRRMRLSNEIGIIKKKHNLVITNEKREEEIKQKILSYRASELVKENILSIYVAIFRTSKDLQR